MNDETKKEDEELIQQSLHGNEGAAQAVPLTNEKFEPVADGGIPQNSEGIVQGQYDSLDGSGVEKISFKQGNYNQVLGFPKLISDKVTVLNQTLVPLISVALIELLGNNQMFEYTSGVVGMSFQNNQLLLSGTLTFTVNNWVGTDIDTAAIAHDSNYVLNRIRPVGANISKCEINTEGGTLVIMFTI